MILLTSERTDAVLEGVVASVDILYEFGVERVSETGGVQDCA